jgi:5,10-methylenetetrahydromethanopterin reductase
VVLNCLVSPSYTAQAMAHLAEGAARAGRDLAELDRPQLVVCSLAHDRAAALVPDEVVQLIAASGTPEECRAKVSQYIEGAAPARSPTRSEPTSGP